MNAIVLTQIQLTMYSKTGHHTESWDTPTPLGCCHLVCLNWECLGPSWTRPLIICMRPEVPVRMRGMRGAARGPFPGIQGFPRMRTLHKRARQKKAWRRLGHSVQNRIKTWLKLRDRSIMKVTIRMSTYETRNFNQVKYNTILHNIYIKMISES